MAPYMGKHLISCRRKCSVRYPLVSVKISLCGSVFSLRPPVKLIDRRILPPPLFTEISCWFVTTLTKYDLLAPTVSHFRD